MKKSKSFITSCILSSVNLIVLIVHIIFCLINSYILNEIIIIIPIVTFLISLLFLAIKKIPNVVKLILSILFLLASLACFTLFNLAGGHIEFRVYEGLDEINSYNKTVSESQFSLFDKVVGIEKCGNFEDITTYKYHSTGIFQQLAFTTILKYDDSNFTKEVEKINAEYDFYETSVYEDEPVPIFTKDGFDFRLSTYNEQGYEYPKHMSFIGINESTKEIAYIDFKDDDLDGVWDFEDLLDSYCGWKHIAKERA